ncbi:MAG: hypothetical protein EON54_11185 [Alcaligenaceae bacterium]|nr:MAG: hypothetical protein EON54_11185 [Alcaligenaceae bacterium]
MEHHALWGTGVSAIGTASLALAGRGGDRSRFDRRIVSRLNGVGELFAAAGDGIAEHLRRAFETSSPAIGSRKPPRQKGAPSNGANTDLGNPNSRGS